MAEPTVRHPRVVSSYGGGADPEQHWGTLDDGREIYFRMRHGRAALHAAPAGTPHSEMPLVNPQWAQAGRRTKAPFFADPFGVHVAYPGGDHVGQFLSDADRTAAFAACLESLERAHG